ncbi:MAG: hypothetical protein CL933_04390 [Deltaproteobacteria bacterium]|nr:hypothetical protein [Deltaproteobacteria bacterium]
MAIRLDSSLHFFVLLAMSHRDPDGPLRPLPSSMSRASSPFRQGDPSQLLRFDVGIQKARTPPANGVGGVLVASGSAFGSMSRCVAD